MALRRPTSPRSLVLAAFLVIALEAPALAVECGDFDRSGVVAASDALRLLKQATGQVGDLYCSCATWWPGKPDPDGVVSDCFGDAGCEDPVKPYCDSHVCSECSRDEHCQNGWACDHYLYRCAPYQGFQCGDVDWNGVIGSSDALRVLRISAGLIGQLFCPPCFGSSTSTTYDAGKAYEVPAYP